MTENIMKKSDVEGFERNLVDLNDAYRKHGEYIKAKYKVSALEMEILQYISLEGPQKMKDIGEHFNIKLSTLTSIIDKIEKQKLVKRVNSKEDRRVVYLAPSRKGNRLYSDYSRYLQAVSQKMSENLGAEQFRSFLRGIQGISDLPF